MFETIRWTGGGVVMLDQRRLPGEEIYLTLTTAEEVADAIRAMAIRGAPAIGVAAAMGLALGARKIAAHETGPAMTSPPVTGPEAERETAEFMHRFEALCALFASTRPTAVNLFWAIERMKRVARAAADRSSASELPGGAEPPLAAKPTRAAGARGPVDPSAAATPPSAAGTPTSTARSADPAPHASIPPSALVGAGPLAASRGTAGPLAIALLLAEEAARIKTEDIAACRAIGRHGQALVPDGACILTHCNAGALATAGYGTALGVIRAAKEAGKEIRVFADETRPFLQGSRLTAWELLRDDIETTIITDSMAGHFLRKGEITLALVGADRIAANGDVANKIGTYQVAVLAKESGVPFYVAAPITTIDLSITDGDLIPIEERPAEEVTTMAGTRLVPPGAGVRNPAFDVTPHRYITAIITDRGIARPPYDVSLKALAAESK